MELWSIYLAKFFSLWFIFMGIAWLYKKNEASKSVEDVEKNAGVSAVAASINIIIGIIIVTSHNIWEGWPIVITIIGYLSLIKGLLRLYKPSFNSYLLKLYAEGNNALATGVIMLLLGIYLGFVGFGG